MGYPQKRDYPISFSFFFILSIQVTTEDIRLQNDCKLLRFPCIYITILT